MFNTLSYAKKLEGVGVSREQAETHIQIIAEVLEDGLATKQDLKDFREITKLDIKELRDDMSHQFKELRDDMSHQFKDIGDDMNYQFKDVRDDMQKLEYRVTIKMGVMMTVAVSILLALLKTHS